MPKQNRPRGGPEDYQQQLGVSLAPAPMYSPSRMPVHGGTYYDMPTTTAPSSMALAPHPTHQNQQHMPPSSYDSYTTSSAPAAGVPPNHRPSSGAWTLHDDRQLMAARAQGLNWNQIRSTYFENKTANACRKRHERLAERRSSDDWDNQKLQRLAKEYMSMRKEIWSGLAERTGEKWNVVEQKCMSNGLKNIQTAARAATRRERLQSQSADAASGPLTGYEDDSGISGIGLTPVDELDASYSSPETSSSGGVHSTSSSIASTSFQQHPQHVIHHVPSHSHGHHMQNLGGAGANGGVTANYQYIDTFGMPNVGYSGPHTHNRYASSVSSNASTGGRPYHGSGAGVTNGERSTSPFRHGQRQQSADMGIGSIINRSGGMH